MNKHLKPGVAVDVRGASDEDVQAVIDACVAIGAHRGCDSGEEFVKWGVKGSVWSSFSNDDIDGILPIISINQALGRESEVENNELPAVGSHLEVSWGNKSMWHECVVLPSNRLAIDRYAGWHVVGWQDDYEFRPLKTEKEKFVERAKKEFPDFYDEFYFKMYELVQFIE